MNPPKVTDEDYINFIIATPRDVTATEAGRVQPESKDAPAHDAFTRLLLRLEPDAETLWTESQTQIERTSGILVLDDSTLEKPYSNFNALVYRQWSGKQKEVVSGINLITLLWTDGVRCVPVDYRVFDKDRDGKTKNDHFTEMLPVAFERRFDDFGNFAGLHERFARRGLRHALDLPEQSNREKKAISRTFDFG